MMLPEIAIRRPVFAWMLMTALILFGGISAARMGISQLPDVDFPVVTVSVDYLGAAPVRGTRFGGSGEQLKVAVNVDQAAHQTQN